MSASPPRAARAGSTLLVTLFTLSALSILAAYTLMRAAPNVHIAHQNASWQEARVAAEAGIDAAMNDLLLNATGFAPGAWTGWQEDKTSEPDEPGSLIGGVLQTASGVVKSLKSLNVLGVLQVVSQIAEATLHQGSSAGAASPVISTKSLYLDNVRVSAARGLQAAADIQLWALEPASNPNTRWFRIRSMGTCAMPPTAYRPPANLDVPLRRFSLRQIRPSLQKDDVGNATTVPLPNISRTVEVLVQPILSFELALWTDGRLTLPNTGNWDIDSFDSSDPAKSAPGGLYPGRGSPLVQANGHVASSAPPPPADAPPQAAIIANGTKIHGAVATNGGDDPTTAEHENVSGAGGIEPRRVHDDFSRNMIPLLRPEGEFMSSPPGDIFIAGPVSAPSIYSIHGDQREINLYSSLPLGQTAVVILIDGDLDLTAPLVVPPNVIAVLYVRGNITFRGAVNSGTGSSNRAARLLIFGDGHGPSRQTLQALGDFPICAAFYGPNTDVVLDGRVHWIGSLNALSLRVATAGNGGIHYDEALATLGPTIGFRIARYIEDVRR